MSELLDSQKVIFSAFFDSSTIPSEDKIKFLVEYMNKINEKNNPDDNTDDNKIDEKLNQTRQTALSNERYEGCNLNQLNITRLPIQQETLGKTDNDSYSKSSATDEVEMKSLHSTTVTSTAMQKPEILLIEDDIILQKTIARTFTKKGCHVVMAVDSVSKARDAIKARAYDLVVCDLGLLEGTGIDVINWVKHDKTHPNQTTPFLVLTANNDESMRRNALNSGFLAVMQKPLIDEVAQNIIDTYIYPKKKRA